MKLTNNNIIELFHLLASYRALADDHVYVKGIVVYAHVYKEYERSYLLDEDDEDFDESAVAFFAFDLKKSCKNIKEFAEKLIIEKQIKSFYDLKMYFYENTQKERSMYKLLVRYLLNY